MRLPSKPYSTLPIYSLGPSAVAKEEASGASAPAEPEKHPFGSGHSRHSLRRSVYKYVTGDYKLRKYGKKKCHALSN